jgi:hypothetical protein
MTLAATMLAVNARLPLPLAIMVYGAIALGACLATIILLQGVLTVAGRSDGRGVQLSSETRRRLFVAGILVGIGFGVTAVVLSRGYFGAR